ncbi:ester cyclase [Dietzia sp. ANT_WB102]|uniref:ester cyclase n=1 Tax=Dietzia sp. ANT_WB102 TaxID=2597345 RepID=UPI002103A71A|nr:ester cyclase [Dietzia sp. ANT_WB102]
MDDIRALAARAIRVMAVGDRSDFDALIAPGAVNHAAVAEPPACKVTGPDGFYATALWLRGAFADLDHRIEHIVAQDDLVVVDTTMSGRHVAPFVIHDEAGRIDTVWAPTGRSFATRQSHWLRVLDDQVTEHWAVRDDLGQSIQLGWIPPTPWYLARCARAKRLAIRASRAAPTPVPKAH